MKGVLEEMNVKVKEFFVKLFIVEKVLNQWEVEIENFREEVKVFVSLLYEVQRFVIELEKFIMIFERKQSELIFECE